MVIAFYCIMEPEKRAELLKLAETFATESQVVEGFTHFLLLDRNNEAEVEEEVEVEGDDVLTRKRDAF